MHTRTKFDLFYLRCASQLSAVIITLWHTFGHPLWIELNLTLAVGYNQDGYRDGLLVHSRWPI